MTPPVRKDSGEIIAIKNVAVMTEIVIKEPASADVLQERPEPTVKTLAPKELSDWTVLKNAQLARMV